MCNSRGITKLLQDFNGYSFQVDPEVGVIVDVVVLMLSPEIMLAVGLATLNCSKVWTTGVLSMTCSTPTFPLDSAVRFTICFVSTCAYFPSSKSNQQSRTSSLEVLESWNQFYCTVNVYSKPLTPQ